MQRYAMPQVWATELVNEMPGERYRAPIEERYGISIEDVLDDRAAGAAKVEPLVPRPTVRTTCHIFALRWLTLRRVTLVAHERWLPAIHPASMDQFEQRAQLENL
jgi:hypothetical protein